MEGKMFQTGAHIKLQDEEEIGVSEQLRGGRLAQV